MTAQNDEALDELVLSVDEENVAREGAPGSHPEFDRLVRTIWRLRQPDGCPWDRAQTHESITKNFIEEAYEAVEAIRDKDHPHMREEFGDVLEQVLLHAQIEADEGGFTIDNIAHDLNHKLVRRHPHVFGDGARASDAEAALDSWDEVKRKERESSGKTTDAEPGLLDSVPRSLPALMQCQKISKRAAKAGFEWACVEEVWNQVDSERAEFLAEEQGSSARAEEFGDILFALVNVARWEGIDAEEALAASNAKFRKRWDRMEKLAAESKEKLEDLSTQRQNELWERVKLDESS